jgi:hypothetical protein
MNTRRSTGRNQMSRALWYAKPGVIELKPEQIGQPKPDEAQVRALYSGISRGTERLIFTGQVAPSEYERMRAPMQAGNFPFPVKYGYCAVGRVEIGPADLQGTTVFCLHPHQEVFNARDTGSQCRDGAQRALGCRRWARRSHRRRRRRYRRPDGDGDRRALAWSAGDSG